MRHACTVVCGDYLYNLQDTPDEVRGSTVQRIALAVPVHRRSGVRRMRDRRFIRSHHSDEIYSRLSWQTRRSRCEEASVTWKELTMQLIVDYCINTCSQTFHLREFYKQYAADFAVEFPTNKHRVEKVRQTLQYLRNDGFIDFVDDHGTYSLHELGLPAANLGCISATHVLPFEKGAREYFVEIRARNKGWVRLAREVYGDYCLIPHCQNTFLTVRGRHYIEVHHVTALSDEGDEGIENLSVVCAHHHRMAHFATTAERDRIQNELLERTAQVRSEHRFVPRD